VKHSFLPVLLGASFLAGLAANHWLGHAEAGSREATSLATQASRLGTPYPQTEFCARVRPQFDAINTQALQNPAFAGARRIQIAASLAEFDSLCAVDARLATQEAEIFLREEADRSDRILEALKTARAVSTEH